MSQTQAPRKEPTDMGPRRGPMAGPMPVEKAKNFGRTLKRLVQFLAPYRKRLIAVFILAVISTAAAVYAPKVLGRITDIIFDGVKSRMMGLGTPFDYAGMLRIGAFLFGIYAINGIFFFVENRMMVTVAQKTVYNMRLEVDRKLRRLPLKYYDDNPRGEILSRVTNDIDNIAGTLQETLNQMVSSIVMVVGVIIMMFTVSGIMTLVTLVTIALCLFITMVVAKRSQKQFSAQWKSTGRLNAHVEEVYSGHNVVKLFNRQEEEGEKFEEENGRLRAHSFKAQFLAGNIMPLMMFVTNLNYVAVCVVGAFKIIGGALLLGDVTAFIAYSRQVNQPIQQTGMIINTLQSTMASAERVFELLDADEQEPEPQKPAVLRRSEGHVRFEHVSFRYRPDTPLIEDLNIDVSPGQTVAIVGPTGAGKTTLVNLLMRFYEVDSGRITVDGVDIHEMTRENLREQIGMVLQDAWLYSGTVRENIAYGWAEKNGEADEELIFAAADAAYADHFIRTLSEGYDTMLDDDASNISQGQKQLLTIARAFLAARSILILDEATSSVDTRTEVLIQKAMAELMLGRTSFVIAHRLSTIRDADIILVMDNGSIVEQGNHRSLLEKGGFYAELYNSQFNEEA